MATIEVSDELHRVISEQVARGMAPDAAALVEDAVHYFLGDDTDAIEGSAALHEAIAEGLADLEAGRFVTIDTPEDLARLHEETMTWVRRQLSQT